MERLQVQLVWLALREWEREEVVVMQIEGGLGEELEEEFGEGIEEELERKFVG